MNARLKNSGLGAAATTIHTHTHTTHTTYLIQLRHHIETLIIALQLRVKILCQDHINPIAAVAHDKGRKLLDFEERGGDGDAEHVQRGPGVEHLGEHEQAALGGEGHWNHPQDKHSEQHGEGHGLAEQEQTRLCGSVLVGMLS